MGCPASSLSCSSRSSGAGGGRSGPAAREGGARRGSAAPGEGGGSGGGAGRGAGCRVRVRLRPEPFHEALVATQQVRLPGGASQTPRRLLGGRAGRLQRCSKALSLTWPCI